MTKAPRSLVAGIFAFVALADAGCDGNSTPSFAPIATATPALSPQPAASPTPATTSTPSTVATATPIPTAPASPATSALPTATASPNATASPTSAASPAPTASSAALAVTPATTSFNAVGYAQTFVASETGYTGNLAAASTDCSGIATFSPSGAAGPSATFSASSVAAGTCHITISDTRGQTAVETIVVTTTGGAINVRTR